MAPQKMLIIQWDGVSHAIMKKALNQNTCPFMQSLIDSEGFEFHEYFCGVPATTLSTQAALLYGIHNIPCFTFFDRASQTVIRGSNPDSLPILEDTLQQYQPIPLLVNGSSIGGLLNAGATKTSLSISNLKSEPYYLSIIPILGKLIQRTNPFRILLVSIISFRILLVAITYGLIHFSVVAFKEKLADGIVRIFSIPLITHFIKHDLLKNSPALYANYFLYDELSHNLGPETYTGYSALSLIDGYCKEAFETAEKAGGYSVVFFSDHGQVPGKYFNDHYKRTYTEIIASAFEIPEAEFASGVHIKPDVIEQKTALIIPTGGLLNMYFRSRYQNPYTYIECEQDYPHALQKILDHPGFSVLVIREGNERQRLMFKEGYMIFHQGNVEKTVGTIPKECKEPQMLKSWGNFVQNTNNGDIVLFSSTVQNKLLGFEEQEGIHGGYTGAMLHPFIMTNNKKILRAIKADNSMENVFDTIYNVRFGK